MKVLYGIRLVLSSLVFLAIGTILEYLSRFRPDFSWLNFLSYFTNQSNLLVALFFLVEGFLRLAGRPLSRFHFDRIRGALLLYMTMTTSIYWLFLHNIVRFSETPAYVANIFQHSGCWLFLLMDMIWDRPQSRVSKRSFVLWLGFPLAYTIAILLQGMMRHWFPYPFLNIEHMGISRWMIWNGSAALAISVIAVGIILLNNRLMRVEKTPS